MNYKSLWDHDEPYKDPLPPIKILKNWKSLKEKYEENLKQLEKRLKPFNTKRL